MPNIKIKIKPDGKIETDYIGFPNNFCDKAEHDLLARLRNLKMETEMEERKDEELLQEEEQYE